MKYSLFFILMLPLIAYGELSWKKNQGNFSVEIEIPEEKISLTFPLKVQLKTISPETYNVDIEDLKKNLLHTSSIYPSPFSIISADVHNESLQDGRVQQQFDFLLQPQLIGKYPLTFRNIVFNSKDSNQNEEIVSQIFTIQIESQNAETAFDINAGPLLPLSQSLPITINQKNRELRKETQSRFQETYFPWIELLIAILAITFLWIAFKSREIKPVKETEAQQIEKARAKVLTTIDELRNQEKNKNFYIDLTDAVREYIEKKYDLHAPTLTTPEFLQEVAQLETINVEEREKLSHFLNSADRVKFAKHQPTDSEFEDALSLAQDLVAVQG